MASKPVPFFELNAVLELLNRTFGRGIEIEIKPPPTRNDTQEIGQ